MMYVGRLKRKSKFYPSTPGSEPQVLKEAQVAFDPAPSGAMVRTQIYLSRAEYDFLQVQARRREEPMAAVIRSYIDEKMQVPQEVWENNPLLAPPADPGFIGPEDGAINHDHYVHGAPKKWMKRKGQWVPAPALPADYYTDPKSAAAYNRGLEKDK